MRNRLASLIARHRALDERISRAPSAAPEVRRLKRERLLLKDSIAVLLRRLSAQPA